MGFDGACAVNPAEHHLEITSGEIPQGEDMVEGVAEDMANIVEDVGGVTEDTRQRGLIRAARKSCPRDDDKNVEGDPEPSDTNDDTGNSRIDIPKVTRQCATEQQERKLQHQRQGLHHIVKTPGGGAIQLPLAILAAFYGSPSHASRCVSVQPLFAEHCEEGRKKRSGEAGV